VPTSGEALRVFRLIGGIDGRPETVEPATFASVGALELKHIEEWLKKEPTLLGEDLLVIASQLTGFDRTRDRPDLLALDDSGKLVVVEIKRDESGSGQDLQALRYAAYASTLQADQVAELFRHYRRAEHGETLSPEEAQARLEDFAATDSLDALDEDEQPRIILVARDFRAGVTNTVLWLSRNFGLDISCVQLVPYSVDGALLLTSNVLIPLPEAADYEVRLQEKRRKATEVREGKKLDLEAAKAFIARVPAGRWTTYGDVASAGGSPGGAQAIGTWLLRGGGIPNVWRVLNRHGEVSSHWKGVNPGIPATAAEVIERLREEGVEFDENGRADPAQRWIGDDEGRTARSSTDLA
jgi:alkylated DNA nucleotide flippase Atl1